MNKAIRIYILRRSFDGNQGCIDIFMHGNTPGSQWVDMLQFGDMITTGTEIPDNNIIGNQPFGFWLF